MSFSVQDSPRFAPGDLVCDRFTGVTGKVLKVINSDDREDIATQGYRYYVRPEHGHIRSIPESALLLALKKHQ